MMAFSGVAVVARTEAAVGGCCERAARSAGLRRAAAGLGECTTTGSSASGGLCVQPSVGQSKADSAMEYGTVLRCDVAVEKKGFIEKARGYVARHRERSRPAIPRGKRFVNHQDTPPNVLACDHD